jgi:hypothetical protein
MAIGTCQQQDMWRHDQRSYHWHTSDKCVHLEAHTVEADKPPAEVNASARNRISNCALLVGSIVTVLLLHSIRSTPQHAYLSTCTSTYQHIPNAVNNQGARIEHGTPLPSQFEF